VSVWVNAKDRDEWEREVGGLFLRVILFNRSPHWHWDVGRLEWAGMIASGKGDSLAEAKAAAEAAVRAFATEILSELEEP
jgi:hypothetical protein